jgi:hypothetical protein
VTGELLESSRSRSPVKPICEKVTELAEKSVDQLNDEFLNATMAATAGERVKLGGQVGSETDKAEDELFGAIEVMGQLVGWKQQDPDKASDSAGEERGIESVEICTGSADHGIHVEESCFEIADHGVHVESSTEVAD